MFCLLAACWRSNARAKEEKERLLDKHIEFASIRHHALLKTTTCFGWVLGRDGRHTAERFLNLY